MCRSPLVLPIRSSALMAVVLERSGLVAKVFSLLFFTSFWDEESALRMELVLRGTLFGMTSSGKDSEDGLLALARLVGRGEVGHSSSSLELPSHAALLQATYDKCYLFFCWDKTSLHYCDLWSFAPPVEWYQTHCAVYL